MFLLLRTGVVPKVEYGLCIVLENSKIINREFFQKPLVRSKVEANIQCVQLVAIEVERLKLINNKKDETNTIKREYEKIMLNVISTHTMRNRMQH